MEADPARRHDTADDLAADLEAFARWPRILKRAAAVSVGVVLVFLVLGALSYFFAPTGAKAGGAELSIQVWRNGQVLRLMDAVPLERGDEIQVRSEIPAGLEAALFWFDTEGRFQELPAEKVSRPGSRLRLSYPEKPESYVEVTGPPGTELIFLCARSSGKPAAGEIEGLVGKGEPLPELPKATLFILCEDGVKWNEKRGPGAIREHAQSAFDRLETLRRRLLEQYSVVSGLCFPRE
jgi:hypothetical protein